MNRQLMRIKIKKLRKKLLRKYAAVFKRDLGKEDRVNLDPVKIELIDSSKDMGNAMNPAGTPRHLQIAAAEELARQKRRQAGAEVLPSSGLS